MKSYKETIKQANDIFSDLHKRPPFVHPESERRDFVEEIIKDNYERLYNYYKKIDKIIWEKED